MKIGLDQYQARVRTPFATLGILTDETHLVGVRFLPMDVTARAPRTNTIAHLVCVQLMHYLDDPRATFDVPLKLAGSKHQLDVWDGMRAIAVGRTVTYGALAEAVHSNARAVGMACGQNPIPVIVPCHRVIAANGQLGGFMGGKRNEPLAIKQWLLRHEGALLI